MAGLITVNKPGGLGANSPLVNVLFGTPVTDAIARDTIIFSNPTEGGDFLFAANRSGNSKGWLRYDNANDAIIMKSGKLNNSATVFALGTYTFTEGTPPFTLTTTNASVSGSTSAEPFLVSNTQTGIAGVGGRARFFMTTNVALGGWSNALKAEVTYGATGRTTGLGSAFVAELKLSAGTTSGTYAPLESELVAESGAKAGTAVSFLYMDASDAATVINSASGYLFEIGDGVTDTAGGIFETESNTDSMSMTHVLKIRIRGVTYYIPLNTSKAF